MNYILVGSAWPYANGSLHIGHLAGLLPADVIARYHRAKKDRVYFVSGSDCHGTPVAIRAKQEHRTPREISDRYHKEFEDCFHKLGFSYDCYIKTSLDAHKAFVRKFHKKLYESPYVYEKEQPQAYCEHCKSFLADRFVTGKCPTCGADTRGDQCDACGAVLEPEILIEPVCAVCGEKIGFRNSKHLYIAISKLQNELKAYVDSHTKENNDWRKNAVAFTNRYIDEGLRDRALTRDLDWGIDVPKEGYETKKIYIWAENVLGYLSASKIASEDGKKEHEPEDFKKLWGKGAKHYYVHGKDNIPFHTIILPALLLANGQGWHLPDRIISSEYQTLEGRKISTSQNYAIWVNDIVERYDPDSIRYYFLANGPERKDADFSWREFVNSHNGELLGAYGNFVNRCLTFVHKYCNSTVPIGYLEPEWEQTLKELYIKIGAKIEHGECKDAIKEIFDVVRAANKYFDTQKPWITRNTDLKHCEQTLFNCIQIIANLANVLHPFLPFSSEKVISWLKTDILWQYQSVNAGYKIPEIQILFQRLDKVK